MESGSGSEKKLSANVILKRLIKLHLSKNIEGLKNCGFDAYYICDTKVDEITKQAAEELGYKYIKDKCVRCGKEIYRLNIETRARIICLDCAKEDLKKKLTRRKSH